MYTHPGGIISQSITDHQPTISIHPQTRERVFQSHGFTKPIATLSVTIQYRAFLSDFSVISPITWECRQSVSHIGRQGLWHQRTAVAMLTPSILVWWPNFLYWCWKGVFMSDTQNGCSHRAIKCWPNNESSNVCLLWLLCTYLQIMPQGYPHCGDIYKLERFLMAPCEALRKTARPT